MTGYYYHAGATWGQNDEGGSGVEWSNHTRRTKAAAEAEARKIARRLNGATPCVEYWTVDHGLRPGWACAEGCYDVT